MHGLLVTLILSSWSVQSRSWLRQPYPKSLAKWSNLQFGETIWRSRTLHTEARWLTAQFIRPSDGAISPECPVHSCAWGVGEHCVVCLLHFPWLVWNPSLAIFRRLTIKDQLVWQRALGRCLRLHIFLWKAPPSREGNVQDLVTEVWDALN